MIPFFPFGTRPELLRRVSCHSLVIPGQTVELLSNRPRDGFMKVRAQTGTHWEVPPEFLLLPGQPDPELEVLEPPQEMRRHRTRRVIEAEESILRTIDGVECIVARDGTYRPVTSDPYRGSRAIAASQALGRRFNTESGIGIEHQGGLIVVTLIQPPKREEPSIRAHVVKALIAATTDGEFDSATKKLRARRCERNLAERVRALRHVGDKTADEREIRHRVGVQVREIRSV